MFELRIQNGQASRACSVDGLPRGSFRTYDEALCALDIEHQGLAAQLAANGEGGTGLQLRMAIVEVGQGAETGLLWSSYTLTAVQLPNG